MVKMNLEEALASLRNSLRQIKSLLAWEQLKHSEAKSDQSPGFKMYDPTEADLRNEYSFFLSKSTEIHRILNNSKTNVSKSKRKEMKRELAKIEREFHSLNLQHRFSAF